MSLSTNNAKPKSILKNKGKSKVTKEIPIAKEISSEESSSNDASLEEDDDEQSELEGLSDLDEDDEVDVGLVSSEEDDNSDEVEEEEEEDETFPLKKKQKKNKDDGSESFANAFSSIVNSKIKAYDRKDPILARNKVTLKKLESEKLENKAKKAILAEKKQFQDKHRVKQLLPVSIDDSNENVRIALTKEKNMKKIAQKGVVKLFNAVLSTQIKTNLEVNGTKMGVSKKEDLMTDVSKEKFLDLIAAAGGED
ncbi:RRP15 [Candida pseudojiufengensis]|uniref:RRP15 n=1 Tax=Candida pseudojiufengensis TaxID=497109 RepID=UPI002225882D|nr:RRP15 [Candida pseudojiufengensis]KAI5965244.1 RRP15 [Candida pseudojiufengensis]